MGKVISGQPTYDVDIVVDSSSIDTAIEKANRLVELLREASFIIDSLSGNTGVRNLID